MNKKLTAEDISARVAALPTRIRQRILDMYADAFSVNEIASSIPTARDNVRAVLRSANGGETPAPRATASFRSAAKLDDGAAAASGWKGFRTQSGVRR